MKLAASSTRHPSKRNFFVVVCAWSLFLTLFILPSLHAQIVADGTTNTLSNATNNISGDVTVGTNGSFTLLVLSNNALLRNSANGAIGLNTAARSNEVQLLSASARWLIDGELFIGSNGTYSRLVVSNGALVTSFDGVLAQQPASSNNFCIVTDTGSFWQMVGSLDVGYGGGGNQMVISNGGRVEDANGRLGMSGASTNNDMLVTGAGSVWSNRGGLFVGILRGANRLVISNGAQVVSATISYLGGNAASVSNEVVVTGAGSLLKIGSTFDVGSAGAGNRLFITEGGRVASAFGSLGFSATSSGNLAVVSGAGSTWSNTILYVGQSSPGNRLVLTNGGTVIASNAVYVGFNPVATGNRIEINGGGLFATNTFGDGLFEVRQGTNTFDAGLIEVDQLLLTNGLLGKFEFNGGILSTKSSRVSVGNAFIIGNNVSPATFMLTGNGVHDFNGTLVVSISSNAVITGNGTLIGPIAVSSGGTLSPGNSIGRMIFSNAPGLAGTVAMEISKDGSTLTNDQIQVVTALAYGGSLIVSNVGPSSLAAGDRFPLFSANSYTNAFTNISLPTLDSGLHWTNKLLVDGSVEVVAVPQPKFASITLSGSNVVLSGTNGPANAPYVMLTATNVTAPMSNWLSIATNQFDASGNFSFTNPITPGEFQRYFRIRTP